MRRHDSNASKPTRPRAIAGARLMLLALLAGCAAALAMIGTAGALAQSAAPPGSTAPSDPERPPPHAATQTPPLRAPAPGVAPTFREMDRDGDGRLTSAEYARAADPAVSFTELDDDQDNALSPDEYAAVMRADGREPDAAGGMPPRQK